MEASVEPMSRGTVRHADTVLIVLKPYYRSLETAGRMAPLARGLGSSASMASPTSCAAPRTKRLLPTPARRMIVSWVLVHGRRRWA
jgi:homoserine kinase